MADPRLEPLVLSEDERRILLDRLDSVPALLAPLRGTAGAPAPDSASGRPSGKGAPC